MPFEDHHVAFAEAIGRQLAGGHASEREEQTVCTLAALSLRHAYPTAVVAVSPAPGRRSGALGLGTLDVRLSWPFSAEPALLVRVVVHDELVRGLWREASAGIADAVREALAARAERSLNPKPEGPA